MRHPRCFTAVLLAALGLTIALCPFSAEAAKPVKGKPVKGKSGKRPTVRLGLIHTLFRDTPEPLMQILMRPFKNLMEDQTGVYGVLVSCGDQDQLGQEIMDDKVQLGVFHGFEFAWARLKHPELQPLLIAVNQESYLRTLLIVRQDNAAGSAADLKGKVLAVPRLSREHCRLYLERRCALPGTAAEQHYSQVLPAADVEDALDLVVDGKAAATVVDQVELEGYRKNKPGRAVKLKSLLESEPFPCAVLAYNPAALPKNLVGRFRDGMIAAKDTRKGQQMLQLCRITGFEEVPEEYEQMLTDIANAYPPPAAK